MSQPDQDQPTRRVLVARFTDQREIVDDVVATEEPLEIRVAFGPVENRRSKSLAITMRTPGHDLELARGFLCSEGIVRRSNDVSSAAFAGPPPQQSQLPPGDTIANQNAGQSTQPHGNTLLVQLAPEVDFQLEALQRNFFMTSSCGICGKASLDAIHAQGMTPVKDSVPIGREIIFQIPGSLRREQEVFESTGGLHAAGAFDAAGKLLGLREDVGRHNAVDKLIGWRMDHEGDLFPCPGRILAVSGRASFELVQKAVSASFSALVAVGAPSSLAVEAAREFNLTLIGFASSNRFNVYSGEDRIVE